MVLYFSKRSGERKKWGGERNWPFLRALTREETASQARRTGKIILCHNSINWSFTFLFLRRRRSRPTRSAIALSPARPDVWVSPPPPSTPYCYCNHKANAVREKRERLDLWRGEKKFKVVISESVDERMREKRRRQRERLLRNFWAKSWETEIERGRLFIYIWRCWNRNVRTDTWRCGGRCGAFLFCCFFCASFRCSSFHFYPYSYNRKINNNKLF